MKVTPDDDIDTVAKMFWHMVDAHGPRVILRQKEFGIWQSVTWEQFGRIAREIGMGLAAFGFAPGDCGSILSNTKREWLYADMGLLGAGGVSNGIYPTDAPEQVAYQLADSRSTFVFVEDEEQLDKVLEVRARLPLLFCGDELVWAAGIGVGCRFQAEQGEASVQPLWLPSVHAQR